MDRSVEMRLRLNIADLMRNSRTAGRELDALTARAAMLDAQLDSVDGRARAAGGSVQGLGQDANRTGAQIQSAQQRLDAFNASLGRTNTGVNAFGASTQRTGRQLDNTGNAVDRFSGRMGIAVDAVLTLFPALIPVGAVAGQAAAGLATLGIAGVTAGTSMLLAFQGVKEAVKAVQAYQDDPSQKNLEKANDELASMAPRARNFVIEFQKVRPVLSDIQDAAAEGWFPGLTKALHDLDDLAPKLEEILEKTGTVGGFLVADSADSLAGPRWDEFLEFLADEVPTAAGALTRILGDLGHGAAEMWMSFDPGNDEFIDWVERVADGFDDWASSAKGRDDIEGFLAYARENGPEVAEFFTATVGALAGIVEAAAPLGGPTLQALTAIMNVIDGVASSDIATPMLAGVAALRLYARGAALAEAAQARLNASMATGNRTAAARTAAAGAAGRVNFSPYASPYAAGLGAALAAPRPQDVRAQQAAQRAARFNMGAQGAAGLALIAASASGVTEKMDGANAASMALMGTMVAPGWGTAAGLVVGTLMDIAGANDAFVESAKAADQAIGSGDFGHIDRLLQDAKTQRDKLKADQDNWSILSPTDLATDWANRGLSLFGKSQGQDATRQYDEIEAKAGRVRQAIAGLGKEFGLSVGPINASYRSVSEMEKALDLAKPAMDRLGISQDDLVEAYEAQKRIDVSGGYGKITAAVIGTATPYEDMIERLRRTQQWMDSGAGRMSDYKSAVLELATEQGTGAERADRYRQAFDALVAPAKNAETALIAQVEALRAIRQLDSDAGLGEDAIRTEKGRNNLQVTMAYTDAVRERIATMIEAKRSEEDIAATLEESRRQFIESGKAAGFSGEEMAKRATKIGLTPKLIETTFRALNISEFDQKVEYIQQRLKTLPKEVRSQIRADGVPTTAAQIEALRKAYDLTPEEVQTLISIMGTAKNDIEGINASLSQVPRNVESTVTIVERYKRIEELGAKGIGPLRAVNRASGGLVTGPGGPTDDLITARLSNREYVQRAAAVDYYGLPFMDALNGLRLPRDFISGDLGLPPRFAAGGAVSGRRSSSRGGTASYSALGPNLYDPLAGFNEMLSHTTRLLDAFAAATENADSFLAQRSNLASYEEAWDGIAASIKENGRALDLTTAKGRANSAALDALATSGKAFADTLTGTKREQFLNRLEGDIRRAADKLDMSKAAVDTYIKNLALRDPYAELIASARREIQAREKLLNAEIRRDEHAVRREEREVELAKERVQALEAEQRAIRDGIEARLKSDLFSMEDAPKAFFDPEAWAYGRGRPEDFDTMSAEQQQAAIAEQRKLWEFHQGGINANQAAATDPLKILQGDIDQAAEMFRLMNILAERGLKGDALDELTQNASLEQIRAFAQGDQSRIDEYIRLFELRESTANQAGLAGARADGVTMELQGARADYRLQLEQAKSANRELAEANRRLERLSERLERLEQLGESSPERTGRYTGRYVADAFDDMAAAAARR